MHRDNAPVGRRMIMALACRPERLCPFMVGADGLEPPTLSV